MSVVEGSLVIKILIIVIDSLVIRIRVVASIGTVVLTNCIRIPACPIGRLIRALIKGLALIIIIQVEGDALVCVVDRGHRVGGLMLSAHLDVDGTPALGLDIKLLSRSVAFDHDIVEGIRVAQIAVGNRTWGHIGSSPYGAVVAGVDPIVALIRRIVPGPFIVRPEDNAVARADSDFRR